MSRLAPQGMSRSDRRVTIIVNEAETGKKLPVELAQGDDGPNVLRSKLYRLTKVPPENQILLYGGPPYKALRAQLPASLTAEDRDRFAATATCAEKGEGEDSSALTSALRSSATLTAHAGTAVSGVDNTLNRGRVFLFDWRTLAPDRSVPGSRIAGNGNTSALARSEALSSSAACLGTGTVGLGAGQENEIDAEAAEYVGPSDVLLPTKAGPAPSPLPSAEGSVLLATIANYERGSMLALNGGQTYAETSAKRLRGGELCVERMQTQIDALQAAVSNSLDHWDPLQRGYEALSGRLEEQALRHHQMLKTFEQDLAKLGTINLHPALATRSLSPSKTLTRRPAAGSAMSTTSLVDGSGGSESGSGGSGGRVDINSDVTLSTAIGGIGLVGIEGGGTSGRAQQERQQRATLLDCVPVEREQKLLESCRTSQRRFRQEAETVAQKYSAIKQGLEQQRHEPMASNDEVQRLLTSARELCGEQGRLRGELEANYNEAFARATRENWAGDHEKQDAIQRMTELTVTQERIVPLMRDNDRRVMEIVAEIARAKLALSVNMRRRLREVSKLQTDIGKIQKHQDLVSMAWEQKEEQFGHLDKVAKMPAAYRAFLLEVIRRQRYHREFQAKVEEFSKTMAALRSSEFVAREAFAETHLGNLPPVFLEIAPGLRNAPPVFSSPTLTPLYPGELPDVRPDDVLKPDTLLPPSSSSSPEQQGTAEEPLVTPPEKPPETPASSMTTVVVDEGSAVTDSRVGVSASKSRTSIKENLSKDDEGPHSGVTHTGGEISPVPAKEEVREVVEGGDGQIGSESAEAGEVPAGEDAWTGESEVVRTAQNSLKAENARLARELEEARSRLEELEHVHKETNTRAETGVPPVPETIVSANTSVSTTTVDESGLSPSQAARASSAVPSPDASERLARPPDETGDNLDNNKIDPDRAGMTEATTFASRSSGSIVELSRTEKADSIQMEIDRTRSLSAAGTHFEGPSVVIRRSGRSGDGRGYGRSSSARRGSEGGGDLMWSSSSTSTRRPSGSSSSATQSQLAAYRAGLSMLVKLADQLAAAAASASGAIAGPSIDSRAGAWESNQPTAGKPMLASNPVSAQVGTTPATATEAVRSDAQTAASVRSFPAAMSPTDGDDHGVSSSGVAESASDQNATSLSPSPEGIGGDPAIDEKKKPGSGIGKGVGEGGDGKTEAVGGADLTESSSKKASQSEHDEGRVDTKVIYPAGDNSIATTSASTTVVTNSSEEGSREDGGEGKGSVERVPPTSTSTLKGSGDAFSVTMEPSRDRTNVAVEAGRNETSPPSSARQGVAERAAQERAPHQEVESGKGAAMADDACMTASEVGRGREIVVSRAGCSRAVSGSGTVGAGPSAASGVGDVSKIRKAAEHVAMHMKRTHGRVEQLLAYETLAAVPKISMCSFDMNDIALFLPTMGGPPSGSDGTVFLAFHVNCPNRYLSEESITAARQDLGPYPAYILGRIVMIERHVASEEPNEYNVAQDTVYYVLTADNLS